MNQILKALSDIGFCMDQYGNGEYSERYAARLCDNGKFISLDITDKLSKIALKCGYHYDTYDEVYSCLVVPTSEHRGRMLIAGYNLARLNEWHNTIMSSF